MAPLMVIRAPACPPRLEASMVTPDSVTVFTPPPPRRMGPPAYCVPADPEEPEEDAEEEDDAVDVEEEDVEDEAETNVMGET